MSVVLELELPDDAFSSIRKGPQEFVDEMRLAASIKWYEMGTISQEKAAEIAGVTRTEFITSLARFGVSPFQYTSDDIERELSDAS